MFKCFYYCLWRKSWLQLDTRASQPTLSPQYAFTTQFHLNFWKNRLTHNTKSTAYILFVYVFHWKCALTWPILIFMHSFTWFDCNWFKRRIQFRRQHFNVIRMKMNADDTVTMATSEKKIMQLTTTTTATTDNVNMENYLIFLASLIYGWYFYLENLGTHLWARKMIGFFCGFGSFSTNDCQ